MRGRFGPERRCLWISRAPSSATGQSCSATCQELQLHLQQVLPNEAYLGAAAVQEEMRVLAPPQVEGVKGDEKCAQTFEFCMEELYRMLFQADESPERERQLNVRHMQPTSLSKECGFLRMRVACTGVGSFDSGTLQQPSDQVVDLVLPIDSLLHQHGACRDNATTPRSCTTSYGLRQMPDFFLTA